MSRQRFQARAKRVQKLGRDGLVEQNLATGEEKRVSQREADVSFGPERPQEQAAGHRAAQRLGKKRYKQPRPPQPTSEETVRASTPEPIADNGQETAPSMRGAADTPILTTPSSAGEPLVAPLPQSEKRKRSRKRARRNARKKKQAQSHARDAARPVEEQPAHLRTAGDSPIEKHIKKRPVDMVSRQSPRPATTGERLKFEIPPAISDTEAGARDTETVHQQEQWSTPDVVKPDESGGRRHFEAAEEVTTPTPQIAQSEPSPKAPVSKGKGRRRPHTRAGAAVPVDTRSEQPGVEPSPERSRLRFETKGAAPSTDRAAVKRRQAVTHIAHADAKAEETPQRSEREEPAPIPERITEQPQTVSAVPTDVKPAGSHLQFERETPAPPPERTIEQPQRAKVVSTDAAVTPKQLRLQFEEKGPTPPPERTTEQPQSVRVAPTDAAAKPKGTRLQFEGKGPTPPPERTVEQPQTVSVVPTDTAAKSKGSRLQFEGKGPAPQSERTVEQPQTASVAPTDAATKPKGPRLRFEREEPTPPPEQTVEAPQTVSSVHTDAAVTPKGTRLRFEREESAPPSDQIVTEDREIPVHPAPRRCRCTTGKASSTTRAGSGEATDSYQYTH